MYSKVTSLLDKVNFQQQSNTFSNLILVFSKILVPPQSQQVVVTLVDISLVSRKKQ